MERLKTELCGITLDNPVIPASGTFGYGYEFAELYDINILGTFSFKGTTAEPRFGNPTPRIAETPSGMLNAVGLQNPGVEKVVSEELPKLGKCFSKKVIANVGGFSVDEYVRVSENLDAEESVGWLEINVSCPNVHSGGTNFGSDPKAAAEVVAAVKKAVKKPVIPKLSPNVTDIVAVAKACEDAGCAFFAPSPTNQQFPIFPDTALEKLAEKYKYSYWARVDETHSAVRLCTSWATTDENVDALCKDIASVMAE